MAFPKDLYADGPEEHSEPDGDEPDYDEHGMAAMKAFHAATKSGDVAGMWDALKTAYSFCEKAGMGEEEPDGDEGKGMGKGGGHALLLMPHD